MFSFCMRIDWRALYTRARKCARAKKIIRFEMINVCWSFLFFGIMLVTKKVDDIMHVEDRSTMKIQLLTFQSSRVVGSENQISKSVYLLNFQTNQSQRVWELYWRRNNHKVTKFHNFHESEVFYFPLLVFYHRFRDERQLNKYRKYNFLTFFKACNNISRNFYTRI